MEFSWQYQADEPMMIRTFVKEQGISRGLLAKIKFNGGTILVNQVEQNVLYKLQKGDRLTLVVPAEAAQENVVPAFEAIDILYEDAHFLVVNKPAYTASIPSYVHPRYAMANRVKGYYVQQQYDNQVIHIVTRLDRDTTGVMLFAKHQYAHACLDTQLRQGKVDKTYIALVPKNDVQLTEHGYIDAPIGRSPDSIMTRQVVRDGSGKEALTEYWQLAEYDQFVLLKIKLHTGRTHQIRVHFTDKGLPLIGDSLYGGDMTTTLQRQALHCQQVTFWHPFNNEKICIQAPLPEDITQLIKEIEDGRSRRNKES